MKTNFLNVLIAILFLSGLNSCSLGDQHGQRQEGAPDKRIATHTAKEQIKAGSAAIGTIHWGITDDAFGKIVQEWMTYLTVDGIVMLGGLKVNADEVTPTYNKDGHLIKIKLCFQPFGIHPESDYAEEEKRELEKRCVNQNRKLISFADQLSDAYGSPSENQLEEENMAIYSESGTKVLARWMTSDTELKLVSENQLFAGKYGCQTQFRLEISQIR